MCGATAKSSASKRARQNRSSCNERTHVGSLGRRYIGGSTRKAFPRLANPVLPPFPGPLHSVVRAFSQERDIGNKPGTSSANMVFARNDEHRD